MNASVPNHCTVAVRFVGGFGGPEGAPAVTLTALQFRIPALLYAMDAMALYRVRGFRAAISKGLDLGANATQSGAPVASRFLRNPKQK